MNKKLKQEFINCFTGDPVETLKVIGEGNRSPESLQQLGQKMMSDPDILEGLNNKAQYIGKKKGDIMKAEEIREILTNLAKNIDPYKIDEEDRFGNITNKNVKMADRLKALELLGKSWAMFVEKKEVSHNITLTNLIEEAYEVEDDDIIDVVPIKPKEIEDGN